MYSRKPWKGLDYECESNQNGGKIMIVGESHYHKCNVDCTTKLHANLTIRTVQGIVDGEFRHTFFTKIASLFGEGKNVSGFWEKVAFYNFLQELLEKPRSPVTKEMRQNSKNQKLFFEMLRILKPNYVLVLGKANWQFLPSRPSTNKPVICKESRFALNLPGRLHIDEINAYWYPTGESSWALVGAVQHPSSYGFSSTQLRPWIQRFQNYPSNPIAE
jgi:hypothetical protein